ncbi:MAG: NfeD family protein [Actinomycetota bacterium]|jgi:membrane protein implicated in regulation of membrane protease activity|nr:NfeD family protein [Actinomycetota bacterium]
MVNIWFWVWVALAAILFTAEIFTAGFFMLPFGIGAAAAALLEFLGMGVGWQWAVFIVVSAISLVFFRRFSDSVTHEPPVKMGADRLIGMSGIVVEDLTPHSSKGAIRVDHEEWRAETSDSASAPVGTVVIVKAVEGTHLVVDPKK